MVSDYVCDGVSGAALKDGTLFFVSLGLSNGDLVAPLLAEALGSHVAGNFRFNRRILAGTQAFLGLDSRTVMNVADGLSEDLGLGVVTDISFSDSCGASKQLDFLIPLLAGLIFMR